MFALQTQLSVDSKKQNQKHIFIPNDTFNIEYLTMHQTSQIYITTFLVY